MLILFLWHGERLTNKLEIETITRFSILHFVQIHQDQVHFSNIRRNFAILTFMLIIHTKYMVSNKKGMDGDQQNWLNLPDYQTHCTPPGYMFENNISPCKAQC